MSALMSDAREAKYARRKFVNRVAIAMAMAAMAFGLFWLFWILFETVRLGLEAVSYTHLTLPTNREV